MDKALEYNWKNYSASRPSGMTGPLTSSLSKIGRVLLKQYKSQKNSTLLQDAEASYRESLYLAMSSKSPNIANLSFAMVGLMNVVLNLKAIADNSVSQTKLKILVIEVQRVLGEHGKSVREFHFFGDEETKNDALSTLDEFEREWELPKEKN